jgi:hypothetical protein
MAVRDQDRRSPLRLRHVADAGLVVVLLSIVGGGHGGQRVVGAERRVPGWAKPSSRVAMSLLSA